MALPTRHYLNIFFSYSKNGVAYRLGRFGIILFCNHYHCIRESVLPLANRVMSVLSGLLK